MKRKRDSLTWTYNRKEVVILHNATSQNFIFELPTGRLRLDAGRSVRTLASLTKHARVKALIDKGALKVKG